nr:lipid A export permease/ATP-binding protein MsbA [Candidatus Kinetoplastibacterium crithidii]
MFGSVKTYWLIMCFAIALMICGAATQPALALIMKPLLDNNFSSNYNYKLSIPLILVMLAIIRSICNFLSDYLFALISNNILFNIRTDMYRKLLGSPDLYYLNIDTGKLLNKFTIDANNITNSFADVITTLIRESIIAIALLGVLFYISWLLTLIVIIILPFMFVITRFFIKKIRAISKDILNMNSELTRLVSSSIKGQRVIKLFNGYDIEKERFDFVNKSLKHFSMKAALADSALSPLVHFCIVLTLSIIIAVFLSKPSNMMLTIGDFGVFIAALAQIPDPIRKLTNAFGKLQKVLVSADSVFSLIDAEEEDDSDSIIMNYSAKGNIDFLNVKFKFSENDNPIIDNISFHIKAGEAVALVGRSGSGKTTLINMLSRFIIPDSGKILLDGFDINKMTLKALRANISFVGQDLILFNDTIISNICYGLYNISIKGVEEALKAVNLLDFVNSLPNGLYTKVGEDAVLLSSGQRQRLLIARALVKNSPIIVLDEATSSLDNESERYVQDSLEKLIYGRTTLIVAHRLSTVRKVNRIFVVDSGKIVESGSHNDLLSKKGLYSSFYNIQFGE